MKGKGEAVGPTSAERLPLELRLGSAAASAAPGRVRRSEEAETKERKRNGLSKATHLCRALVAGAEVGQHHRQRRAGQRRLRLLAALLQPRHLQWGGRVWSAWGGVGGCGAGGRGRGGAGKRV
jgi:hypothetical protein